MKKYTLIFNLTVILFLIISNSCRKAKKNIDDYFPKVNIVSAEIQQDGSVLLTGQIESKGVAEIEYAGFSCNSTPSPKLLDRQVIAEMNGSVFTATISNFDIDSTYYFRVWATNDYGYKFGNEISLSNITPPLVTPSCTLNKNYLNYGAGSGSTSYYSVSAPSQSSSTWDITANSGSYPLHLAFGSPVNTGIYTTVSGGAYQGTVQVYFTYGWLGSFSLNDGSKVYVNRINGGDTLDITICNAPWTYSSSTFTLNTRFRTPF